MGFKVGDMVECVDPGTGSMLQAGKTYKVSEVDLDKGKVSLEGVASAQWWSKRFKLVTDENIITPLIAHKAPSYVKCVRAVSYALQRGKVYEVVNVSDDGHDYFLQDGKKSLGWWGKRAFEEMPPTYDHEEERVRSILTAPTHAESCSKCSAPLPCAYHPSKSSLTD